MAVKTYDLKSYELAEHFLHDTAVARDPESAAYKEACHQLAIAIQTAVEDWIFEEDVRS